MILLKLFLTFFKIGLFTFGGGYAMLPMIAAETISHGWITETALIDFIAVSESTPGPFAVNIATYIGTTAAGIPGALAATAGVVLPSFIVILLVAKAYDKFRSSRVAAGAMSGLKPAVIGLIGAAALSIGRTVFPLGSTAPLAAVGQAFSAAVFVIMIILAFKKVHPIILIAIAAGLGILAGYTVGLPV